MTAGWTPLRVAAPPFGAAALFAGGLGTDLSLHSRQEGAARDRGPADASVVRRYAAPRELPPIGFHDGQDQPVGLTEFRGKTRAPRRRGELVPALRDEMHTLDRLQNSLRGPGFEVLALSIDAGGAPVVADFYEAIGIESLAIRVDSAMRSAGHLRTPGVLTTLLIDPERRELGRHVRPAQWDDPK